MPKRHNKSSGIVTGINKNQNNLAADAIEIAEKNLIGGLSPDEGIKYEINGNNSNSDLCENVSWKKEKYNLQVKESKENLNGFFVDEQEWEVVDKDLIYPEIGLKCKSDSNEKIRDAEIFKKNSIEVNLNYLNYCSSFLFSVLFYLI